MPEGLPFIAAAYAVALGSLVVYFISLRVRTRT